MQGGGTTSTSGKQQFRPQLGPSSVSRVASPTQAYSQLCLQTSAKNPHCQTTRLFFADISTSHKTQWSSHQNAFRKSFSSDWHSIIWSMINWPQKDRKESITQEVFFNQPRVFWIKSSSQFYVRSRCYSDVGKDSDRIDAVAQLGAATGFCGQWSPD